MKRAVAVAFAACGGSARAPVSNTPGPGATQPAATDDDSAAESGWVGCIIGKAELEADLKQPVPWIPAGGVGILVR